MQMISVVHHKPIEFIVLIFKVIRMLGTFNQHVPIILSNNYWCQSKPRSLLDTGMDVIP